MQSFRITLVRGGWCCSEGEGENVGEDEKWLGGAALTWWGRDLLSLQALLHNDTASRRAPAAWKAIAAGIIRAPGQLEDEARRARRRRCGCT